jgi:hypothetical protein
VADHIEVYVRGNPIERHGRSPNKLGRTHHAFFLTVKPREDDGVERCVGCHYRDRITIGSGAVEGCEGTADRLLSIPAFTCGGGIEPLLRTLTHGRDMKRLLIALACLTPVSVSGCGGGCLLFATSGLSIGVHDAQNHANLIATVTATDGTFSVTKSTNNGNVTPVPGLPCTYNITVSSPGDQDWTRNDVQVKSADRCGQPESVNVIADLQPKLSS